MRSAFTRSRYRAIAGTRLGEPASSSPSRMTFRFNVGRDFAVVPIFLESAQSREHRRSVVQFAVAENGLEGTLLFPARGVHGLAVVVGIEEECPGCPHHVHSRSDQRVALRLEDFGPETAGLEPKAEVSALRRAPALSEATAGMDRASTSSLTSAPWFARACICAGCGAAVEAAPRTRERKNGLKATSVFEESGARGRTPH